MLLDNYHYILWSNIVQVLDNKNLSAITLYFTLYDDLAATQGHYPRFLSFLRLIYHKLFQKYLKFPEFWTRLQSFFFSSLIESRRPAEKGIDIFAYVFKVILIHVFKILTLNGQIHLAHFRKTIPQLRREMLDH